MLNFKSLLLLAKVNCSLRVRLSMLCHLSILGLDIEVHKKKKNNELRNSSIVECNITQTTHVSVDFNYLSSSKKLQEHHVHPCIRVSAYASSSGAYGLDEDSFWGRF